MPTRGRSKRRKSCGTVTQTLESVSVDFKEIPFECAQNSGSTHTLEEEPCHTQNKCSALSHCHSPNTNQDRCPFSSPRTLGLRQRCNNRDVLLICTQCSKSFAGQANYRRHILVHTGERPHCCPVCSRGFSQLGNLQRHMKIHSRKRSSPGSAPLDQREVGEKLRLQDCEEKRGLKSASFLDQEGQESSAIDSCLAEILAPLRSELDRIGFTEEGEESSPSGQVVSRDAGGNSEQEEQSVVGPGRSVHQCPKCSRQFTCKSHLNRHWKVHTGERPYCCPVCGRKFSQDSNCLRHQQLHLRQRRLSKRGSGREGSGHDWTQMPLGHDYMTQEPIEDGSQLLVDTEIVVTQMESEFYEDRNLRETCRAAETLCKLSLDELNKGGEETKERGGIVEERNKYSTHHHQNASGIAKCQNLDPVTGIPQEKAPLEQQCFVSLQENAGVAKQDPQNELPPQTAELSLTQNSSSFCFARADGHTNPSTLSIDSDQELTAEIGIGGRQESETAKEKSQMSGVDVLAEDCEGEETERDEGAEQDKCRRGRGQITEHIGEERENEEVCQKEYEPPEQTIICPLCGLTISILSCLDQHLKSQHPNEVITVALLSPGVNPGGKVIGSSGSDTQCLQCGRSFYSRSNLKKHMLVHSGIRPYTCHDCGLTFNQSGNALRHQRSHHHGDSARNDLKVRSKGESAMMSWRKTNPTRKRPQRARERAVTRKESRDPEDLGNTPAGQPAFQIQFLCYICGCGFQSQDSLDVHEQSHKKEQPYRCPQCDRGFAHVQNFSRHLLVHTGEKPWHCHDCGRCFNQVSNLNRHCRTQGHQGGAAEHTGE